MGATCCGGSPQESKPRSVKAKRETQELEVPKVTDSESKMIVKEKQSSTDVESDGQQQNGVQELIEYEEIDAK